MRQKQIAEFYAIPRERAPTVIPKLKSSTVRVTESWVEMCITEDRLIDPEEHVAYKPLATPMPVPGKGCVGPVRFRADLTLVHDRFEGQSDTSVRISGNVRALDFAAACQSVW